MEAAAGPAVAGEPAGPPAVVAVVAAAEAAVNPNSRSLPTWDSLRYTRFMAPGALRSDPIPEDWSTIRLIYPAIFISGKRMSR